MRFAYIRVSSKDQNEARQVDTMVAQGVPEANIYIDKASGKDTDRAQYQTLKGKLRAGDIVVFDSISRMSRNMDDTKREYEWYITKGIALEFVKEPMLSTTGTAQDDVLQRAIGDIILTILSAFAEKERDDIRVRQAEGIAAAKSRGQRLGRPAITWQTLDVNTRRLFIAQYSRWKAGEQTAVETFKNVGMTKSTFYKIAKEYEAVAH